MCFWRLIFHDAPRRQISCGRETSDEAIRREYKSSPTKLLENHLTTRCGTVNHIQIRHRLSTAQAAPIDKR